MDNSTKQNEQNLNQTPPPPAVHDVNASTSAPTETQPPKPKRHIPWLKILVFGIVALITVAAFALIAYLFMGNQNESQMVNDNSSIVNESPTPTPDPTADWTTYNTECNFSIKHPADWNAEKYFIIDSDKECTYITAPDHELILDSREGFYIHVTRVELDSLGGVNEKFPINSLEDYIKDEESISTPAAPVNQKIEKAYGDLNGISYIGIGFDPGRSFIFENDGYIYKINWPEELENKYANQLENIIRSIKFTDQANSADEMSSIDTSDWKTYTDPELNYQIKYPTTNWTSTTPDKIPDAINLKRYQTLILRTADYSADYTLNSGAEIAISAASTGYADINSLFNNSLGAEIAQNKKAVALNGIETIQYNYSYEGNIATITEFIKDEVHYTLRYRYVSENEKDKYWDYYQEFISSLQFTE